MIMANFRKNWKSGFSYLRRIVSFLTKCTKWKVCYLTVLSTNILKWR